jgi:hypothetical protein
MSIFKEYLEAIRPSISGPVGDKVITVILIRYILYQLFNRFKQKRIVWFAHHEGIVDVGEWILGGKSSVFHVT